jgi:hypothetical protein
MHGLAEPALLALGLGISGLLVFAALRANGRRLTGFELPLVVVVAVALALTMFLLRQETVQLPLLSAITVATTGLFGFFFNALLSERRALREREERRQDELDSRARQIEDICAALGAEIENETAEYDYIDWEGWIARITADFAEDPDFQPVVPMRVRDTVFRTVIGRIELLTPEQIRAIVRYYTLVSDLRELGDLMRSDRYSKMPAPRRETMLLSFIQLEERLRVVGFHALVTFAEPNARKAARVRAKCTERAMRRRYRDGVSPDDRRDRGRSDPEPDA